eukprot:TRINITY_DN17426_c0_g1_i1.p1 TRINITY_DN17426_c0_g1~~TRINITY_DN17426_c0_g1_i1.p1  ORF type:complete len:298 (+),score=38.82 TRINITY_DN17426_c0_g1_i1:50-895(+)
MLRRNLFDRPYNWMKRRVGKEWADEIYGWYILAGTGGFVYTLSKLSQSFNVQTYEMAVVHGRDLFTEAEVRIDTKKLKEFMRITEANLSPWDFLLLPTSGGDCTVSVPSSPLDNEKSTIDNFCAEFSVSPPANTKPYSVVGSGDYECMLVSADKFINNRPPESQLEEPSSTNVPYLVHGSYSDVIRLAARSKERNVIVSQAAIASAALCALGHSIDTVRFSPKNGIECVTTQQYLNEYLPDSKNAQKERGELPPARSGPTVYYPPSGILPTANTAQETTLT